jgi:hypothetical protein
MSLNLIALGLMVVVIGYQVVQAYLTPGDPDKPKLPWVPIDVRRTKHYVSQTKDAGMFIERVRRSAIIGNPTLSPSYKGSTNGSMEWNFLTGVCVCPPGPKVCPTVFGLVDGDASGSQGFPHEIGHRPRTGLVRAHASPYLTKR